MMAGSVAEPSHQDVEFPTPAFDDAIAAWRQAIGEEHVDASADGCRLYGRSTSPWSQTPVAILRPASTEEVQEVVRIAQRHRIPVYPISGGKNWGLGDACPTTAGQVTVDLRRLNGIREVNAELGYAVIEAGVTQRQLYDFLAVNAPSLMLDATGAGPNATIVGNIMERGYGHSPYGDRYAHSCNYEVVLANGQLLRTGFGTFENSQTAHVLKTGLGPATDGLFTQSNYGIVTAMTVWLLPRPEIVEAFAFAVDDEESLTRIVDAIRPLRLQGLLTSTIHIANDLRLISSKTRYPWEETNGATPLPAQIRRKLRRDCGIGAWNVLGGIYGTRATVRATRRAVRHALRGIAKPRFINDGRLELASRFVRLLPPFDFAKRLARQLASIKPAFALLKGEPVADHLRGTGWRNPHVPDPRVADPLDREDGLMWMSPTLPMRGGDAVNVQRIAEEVLGAFKFDLLITYVVISGRAACAPITICFDRRSPAECQRASACYVELLTRMRQAGYDPYRLATSSMHYLGNCQTSHLELVGDLKDALDDQAIVSPGRYQAG